LSETENHLILLDLVVDLIHPAASIIYYMAVNVPAEKVKDYLTISSIGVIIIGISFPTSALPPQGMNEFLGPLMHSYHVYVMRNTNETKKIYLQLFLTIVNYCDHFGYILRIILCF
jgi:hypothetical protein